VKKLFIFDFDGVVVDSLELYEHSVKLCMEKIGRHPIENHEAFLDLFEENFYQGIVSRGIDLDEFMKVSAAIIPTLNYDLIIPFQDMVPVLIELKKDHNLVIVSSNSSPNVRRILAKFGLDIYFDEILGYDFHFSKIDKISHAMGMFKIGKERTYYIGDTTGDIREAKVAGVRTVAVTWGWHPRERLEKTAPDYLIDRPVELLKIDGCDR
jgi:phosphoglycolate phosphatase